MLKKMLLPVLCCVLAMNTLTSAQAAPPQEGRQYTQLAKPVLDVPDVVEFFSFYCPPCAAFAGRYGVTSAVEKVLPANTHIVKNHVSSMGPFGEELTEAWSVARTLGVESQVEIPLFRAVQEKRSIKSKADIRQVFIDAGVPAEQYDSAINSLVVKAMTAAQIQAAEEFGVTGTPSFFVKGKYLIRNGGIESMTEEGYGSAFSEIVRALLQKKSA
ncbi:TPA: DsbA family protein [Escherichia coli]|nr:DsbA family protein [Escherichia coli]